MKPYYLLLLFLVANVCQSKAQVDILRNTNIKRTSDQIFCEVGDYYYFLSQASKRYSNVPTNQGMRSIAYEYSLVKMNKHTEQIVATKKFLGDTSDNNIIYKFQPLAPHMLYKNDGKLNFIVSVGFVHNDTDFTKEVRFIQTDLNLNITIPEKTIYNNALVSYGFVEFGNNYIINVDSIVDDTRMEPITLPRYSVFDDSGNVIKNGNLDDMVGNNFNKSLYYLLKTSDTTVMFYGTNFFKENGTRQNLIVDTNFNLIDSSNDCGNLYTVDNQIMSILTRVPLFIKLPSETYIGSGMIGGSPYDKVFIGQFTKEKRYNLDTFIVSAPYNSSDYLQSMYPAFYNVGYNKVDNRIYTVLRTHIDPFVLTCKSTNYNYNKVICTDTSLNIIWEKYFYSGTDSCIFTSGVALPDNRSGIIVFANRIKLNEINTQPRNSIYYIDSSGTNSINDEQPLLRNRIEVYPNPATNNMTISDVYNQLEYAVIYNMQGAALKKHLLNSKQTFSISELPSDTYFLRVVTKDGAMIHKTIQKIE